MGKTTKEYMKKWREKNKDKIATYAKRYIKKNPWAKHLALAHSRCSCHPTYKARGFKVEVTTQELKDIWFRDKAYLLDRPSLDRIDAKVGYKKNNCQFIELKENISKGYRKPVSQYDLDGNHIKTYESQAQAGRENKIPVTHICACCNGREKTTHKYMWRHADRLATSNCLKWIENNE